jgi:hypothetical protein
MDAANLQRQRTAGLVTEARLFVMSYLLSGNRRFVALSPSLTGQVLNIVANGLCRRHSPPAALGPSGTDAERC